MLSPRRWKARAAVFRRLRLHCRRAAPPDVDCARCSPGTAQAIELERCVDQGDVRQRLREVSQLPLVLGIVFFGQQPNIVAQAQQALEQLACASSTRPSIFRALTIQKLQARNTPSPGGRPSSVCLRAVAQDEAIGHQDASRWLRSFRACGDRPTAGSRPAESAAVMRRVARNHRPG